MLKKYGLRDTMDGYVYFADRGFEVNCRDEDGNFGTDDLNEAFRFKEAHRMITLEVFEKVLGKII